MAQNSYDDVMERFGCIPSQLDWTDPRERYLQEKGRAVVKVETQPNNEGIAPGYLVKNYAMAAAIAGSNIQDPETKAAYFQGLMAAATAIEPGRVYRPREIDNIFSGLAGAGESMDGNSKRGFWGSLAILRRMCGI